MGSFEAQVDSLSTQASSWCLCSQQCGKGAFNNKIIFLSFSLQVLSQIVDFSCKIGEYRELTEKYVISLFFFFTNFFLPSTCYGIRSNLH